VRALLKEFFARKRREMELKRGLGHA